MLTINVTQTQYDIIKLITNSLDNRTDIELISSKQNINISFISRQINKSYKGVKKALSTLNERI